MKLSETWKDIPRHEYYQASSYGNVRSKDKWVTHSTTGVLFLRRGRIMTAQKSKCGYLRVGLSYPNRKVINESVHRLVACAFIPNKELKRTVNHIDGNKLNNSVLNLEWNTHMENVQHSIKIGIKAQAKGVQFVNRSKFDELQIRVIKHLKESHLTQKQIANYFNVHMVTIGDIFNGRSWGHII